MQTRFILGPAGSGKTFRCLAEIRSALIGAPDGPPLLLLAPKQTTYQLERQLLADLAIPGYTRLRILSFERLANFVFEQLRLAPPRMLVEEGRLMVLRALLARKRGQLKLFRASARLTGFAQHLSLVLRELQRQQLTPESLAKLAEQVQDVEKLSSKLQDLATLLGDYLAWLKDHGLQDAERILEVATESLRAPGASLSVGEIWVDGFTEFSPQELDLLAELLPHATAATITLCLDRVPTEHRTSWLAHWNVVERAFRQCKTKLAAVAHCTITTELLPRRNDHSRFSGSAPLRHLEAHWAAPKPFTGSDSLPDSLRIAACANPEAEATLAAREILRFVRAGGRYREITVLARNLQSYHEPLVNIFNRYEIPFFLDRRESVSHHPLAELSRNALRTVALGWAAKDWFAALKTGLPPADEQDIDRLENAAIARGWKGTVWQHPLNIIEDPDLARQLELVRQKVVPPFTKLELNLGPRPSGTEIADALRKFWEMLDVPETLEKWSTGHDGPRPIHLTVWEQMNAWLDNLELAFPTERLLLRDWLPILEAGLAGLAVGVIPPALDQVSIGALDRSRNANIKLAIVLGMNESVFPAPPAPSVLLTDSDRRALEDQGVSLTTSRHQLSQERFYGYVACTRPRERLVLTLCEADAGGKALNPSPFLTHLAQIFPSLTTETVPVTRDWQDSEHASELVAPLLRDQARPVAARSGDLAQLGDLPALTALREKLRHLIALPEKESLSPALAAQLYGSALKTSVSRMEQFAACPFKFFVHSGLRAEERKKFELDARDKGNFQHDVLAKFHEQLEAEGKLWRDLTPTEARERIKAIAGSMTLGFRDGLLESSDEARFTARMLASALEDFVEMLVGWMRKQYLFDPKRVELPFDEAHNSPWELDLENGHRLRLHGRIDRVDLWPIPGTNDALCVVVDYKSSQKKLDNLLMEHGLQLQLPGYLNVLRHWPNPFPVFGVARLIPAGVFYVNLNGQYEYGDNRDETLADAEGARLLAYRHAGRFNAEYLDKLDNRPGISAGDQFAYKRKQNGELAAVPREGLSSAAFTALLAGVEAALKKMGQAIYAGVADVDPYRKGGVTACEHCDYRSVCRIDPWTHIYRVLKKTNVEETE